MAIRQHQVEFEPLTVGHLRRLLSGLSDSTHIVIVRDDKDNGLMADFAAEPVLASVDLEAECGFTPADGCSAIALTAGFSRPELGTPLRALDEPSTTPEPHPDAFREIVDALIQTIEATGGVEEDAETGVCYSPVADPEWLDLGDIYLKACHLLGRKPLMPADDSQD